MRPIRLGPALAAAATLLALAPSGASAARGHHNVHARNHAGLVRCRISTFAEPHVVTSGESAQVFGQLSCIGAASTASQTVTVYQHSAGTPGLKVLGTATTGPGGFFSIIAPALTTDSAFQARFLGIRSANRAVKVAPQVTLSGPADGSQLHTAAGSARNPRNRRNAVTFTGTVTPEDTGALVTLQRENATSNEEWRAIGHGVVGPGGTFSLTHRFIAPGDANIRVVVRRHSRFTIRGVSNTLSYEISQAQNPNLTINVSADPISYGQPVTISGVLAAGANKKVTLLSHARGALFAKVGEATANGSGEYTFAQSPLKSTFYRVTGGGTSSTVLFEGVKYALTAGASATTIQSGQPLMVAGTVAPNHVGHVVYLERENEFRGGFHVVDVGTVGVSSTYSISHFVFGSRKEVFRVRIPGDPENQAVSSSPFTVEVTPAPFGSLRPRAPSILPSEGQL